MENLVLDVEHKMSSRLVQILLLVFLRQIHFLLQPQQVKLFKIFHILNNTMHLHMSLVITMLTILCWDYSFSILKLY